MANLSENPQWVDGIYQIETSDPVVGGPDGVSNRQAKELASRTRYLKKEQEKTGSDLATHAAAADPHTQYAPKENPTFTGAPKAPTPATESNSQQVATTAFVKSVAATKLAKDQNGADIPDKTTFYSNVLQRGTLGDGVTFSSCDKAGDYFVAISDPNTVSDMPTYKGQKLYGYGVLHISQHDHFVGQEYTSHNGDYAWRQKWNDGVYAPWVVALSSSRVPTAADVGALPEKAVAQAAAKLATPRTINGVPFDGTANIALTPANLGLGETVTLAAEALPKSGGAMSGGVRLGGNLDLPLEKRITGIFSDNTYREMLWLASDNSIQVGDVKSEIAIRTKGSLNILVNDKWHQGYHTGFKPTAAELGAITKSDADNNYVRQGSLGVIYKNDDLAWNSPTGAYLKDNGGYTSLIWHMGLNTGSASAAQFHFGYSNSGLMYRSSRDNSGFEKPWARIYSDQDKPTAAEIGALSLNEVVGIPMPWPQITAPSGWLKCNGQAFDKNIYPLLAQAYPSGRLPDLRGEFIRGWDDGRGVDTDRGLFSEQSDAIRNITGSLLYGHDADVTAPTKNSSSGAMYYDTSAKLYDRDSYLTLSNSTTANSWYPATLDVSRVVPTANENRPRNIAFNYIVRAA
ncbi:phage tail protein [Pectobacterium versatile]|uniref:phage tail protein n=1 Tax=Pectobacterium versatile TaxID=2488639 RepID=UPI000B7BE6E5|nr:phage tail protein [Pectobacterium versatile]ASN85235.1 Phage tail protein [Pectobacterium versatile]POY57065.1 tail fiber protein [Pectobacterium versatile]POY65113.1 tail fiber protein [Pectobacterium versatile]